MEPATASPLVKRLEAEGLVARQRSSEDERRLEITLTAAGSALRDRAIDVPHQVMAAVGMGVDEIAALRDGLGPFAGRRLTSSDESSHGAVGPVAGEQPLGWRHVALRALGPGAAACR